MPEARRSANSPRFPHGKHAARSTVARILVLEDRDAAQRAILAALGRDGLDTQTMPRDAPGPAVAAPRPDAVIVGFDAEDGDAFDCLRRMARIVGVVIAVSNSEEAMLPALEAGALDFVTLPDGDGELRRRVLGHLRRSASATTPTAAAAGSASAVTISAAERVVRVDGTPLALTKTEYLLLSHLASRAGTVFTRSELLAAAWGDEHQGDERVVDAHVWRLRRKLPEECPGRIVTVRGFGYMFKPAP
jgi:DNA-binding response OmpR family regulator